MICIIVPVYNVKEYLPRCIDSILAQTFTDYELILVDDGSTDNSGEICDRYAEIDNRIYVIHKENGGLSDARNAGLEWFFENSFSEWITFIDSDDWVHQKYLEILLKCAVKNETKISACYYNTITENKEINYKPLNRRTIVCMPEEVYTNIGRTMNPELPESVYAFVWGKLYDRELWESFRFPVGKLWEDVRIAHKIFFKVNKIAVAIDELYFYYWHQGTISNCEWTPKRYEIISAYEEMMDDDIIKNNQSMYPVVLRDYFETIKFEVYKINQSTYSEKEKEYYSKPLIRKLKKLIRDNRKTLMLDFSDNISIFEKIYPKTMWLYWTWKGIFNKNVNK